MCDSCVAFVCSHVCLIYQRNEVLCQLRVIKYCSPGKVNTVVVNQSSRALLWVKALLMLSYMQVRMIHHSYSATSQSDLPLWSHLQGFPLVKQLNDRWFPQLKGEFVIQMSGDAWLLCLRGHLRSCFPAYYSWVRVGTFDLLCYCQCHHK